MPFIAIINIDNYKKGEVVPDDKAKVWEVMYKQSPVQFVDKVSTVSVDAESLKHKEFDLNNDGVVDSKDVSLAAKTLKSANVKKKK